MNKDSASFLSASFLAKFNPEEFYQISKDLSTAIELKDNQQYEENNTQINSSLLLMPTASFSNFLDNQLFSAGDKTVINSPDLAYNEPTAVFNELTAVSNIPSIEPFPGAYNLQLSIISNNDKNLKKNISWTFSKVLNKLYCCPGVSCPINISLNTIPPSGSIIRITAVYSKPEHIQQVIKRCENHQKKRQFEEEASQVSSTALAHLIRCQHEQASYQEDPETKRHSVIVPYEKPPVGSKWTTFLLQFMCFSSCFGGIQKPLKIIVSLEFNNQTLGRQLFEVKVCASPGRDRNTEESKHQKKGAKPVENTKLVTPAKPVLDSIIQTRSMPRSCSSSSKNDTDVFTLQVKGRKNYEILRHIRDAFEAYSAITKLKRIVSTEMMSSKDSNESEKSTESEEKVLKRKASFSDKENKITLEKFLDNIEMTAYLNLITSKGVKSYEELLACDKKKINSFKISQADTRILWASLQTAKMQQTPTADTNTQSTAVSPVKKQRKSNRILSKTQMDLAPPPPSKTDVSFINDSFFTESFFEISKYQDKFDSFIK